jgi:hypothetical protein
VCVCVFVLQVACCRLKLEAMTPSNLASVVWAVARLGKTGSAKFVVHWAAVSMAKLWNFNSLDLASTVFGLAKLRCGIPVLGLPFFQEWAGACRVRVSKFTAQSLSNVIYALGELGLGLDELGAPFFHEWTRACDLRWRQMTPQGLFNILLGLSRLALGPSSPIGVEFFRTWAEVSAYHYRGDSAHVDVQGLANTPLALARLGVAPEVMGRDFVLAWTQACCERFRQSDCGLLDLGMILEGASRLRAPDEWWAPDFLELWRAAWIQRETAQHTAWVAGVSLEGLDRGGIRWTLDGLGELGQRAVRLCSESPEFSELLNGACTRRMDLMHARHLAHCGRRMAQLKLHPTPHSFLQAWGRAAWTQLQGPLLSGEAVGLKRAVRLLQETYLPQEGWAQLEAELAGIAEETLGVADLLRIVEHPDTPADEALTLWDRLSAVLNTLSDADLATLARAALHSGHGSAPSAFRDLWIDICLSRLPQMDPHYLVALGLAASKAAGSLSSLLEAWASICADRLPRFSESELLDALSVWCAAQHAPLADAIAVKFLSAWIGESYRIFLWSNFNGELFASLMHRVAEAGPALKATTELFEFWIDSPAGKQSITTLGVFVKVLGAATALSARVGVDAALTRVAQSSLRLCLEDELKWDAQGRVAISTSVLTLVLTSLVSAVDTQLLPRDEQLRRFVVRWARVAGPRLESFLPHSLLLVFQSLVRLQPSLSDLGDSFFPKWAQSCRSHVGLLEQENLALLLDALASSPAEWAERIGLDLFLLLFDSCTAKLYDLSPTELANLIYSCGRLHAVGLVHSSLRATVDQAARLFARSYTTADSFAMEKALSSFRVFDISFSKLVLEHLSSVSSQASAVRVSETKT